MRNLKDEILSAIQEYNRWHDELAVTIAKACGLPGKNPLQELQNARNYAEVRAKSETIIEQHRQLNDTKVKAIHDMLLDIQPEDIEAGFCDILDDETFQKWLEVNEKVWWFNALDKGKILKSKQLEEAIEKADYYIYVLGQVREKLNRERKLAKLQATYDKEIKSTAPVKKLDLLKLHEKIVKDSQFCKNRPFCLGECVGEFGRVITDGHYLIHYFTEEYEETGTRRFDGTFDSSVKIPSFSKLYPERVNRTFDIDWTAVYHFCKATEAMVKMKSLQAQYGIIEDHYYQSDGPSSKVKEDLEWGHVAIELDGFTGYTSLQTLMMVSAAASFYGLTGIEQGLLSDGSIANNYVVNGDGMKILLTLNHEPYSKYRLGTYKQD